MFESHYFTGAQARIYIGNYFVDEIIDIEGTYAVEKIPIYSYASHHYNAVAPGKVFVTGSFTINYKADGYILAYLQKFKKDYNSASILKPHIDGKGQLIKDTDIRNVEIKENIYNKRINKLFENKSDMALYTEGDAYTDSKSSESELLKKKYWESWKDGVDSSTGLIRPEFLIPFNIVIKDYKIGTELKKGSGNTDDQYYDIYGGESSGQKTIVDCHINRISIMRRADGTPVMESYGFIAKSIV